MEDSYFKCIRNLYLTILGSLPRVTVSTYQMNCVQKCIHFRNSSFRDSKLRNKVGHRFTHSIYIPVTSRNGKMSCQQMRLGTG